MDYAGADVKEIDYGQMYHAQTDALKARYGFLKTECKIQTENDYVGGTSYCCSPTNLLSGNRSAGESGAMEIPEYEKSIFFYHPDHLGSTTIITNFEGEITQSVAYVPFGEVFVEERSGVWNTPYLFNAKELDEETGMYYYGARYLDPMDIRWIGVDPMWEDHIGISPYNYCLNNPIKMVDPNGMWEQDADGNWVAQKGDNAYTLAKSMNINPSDAIALMKEQGFGFSEGDKKVFLKVGDIVKSDRNIVPFFDFSSDDFLAGLAWYPQDEGLQNASLIPFLDPIFDKLTEWGASALQYFGISKESSYTCAALGLMFITGKTGPKVGKTPKVHGNSLSSSRPTWGYKLYEKESGKFLKNGITSKVNPERRYTKSFMNNKEMKKIGPFPNRRQTYEWEYEQNCIQRGPLNRNMH